MEIRITFTLHQPNMLVTLLTVSLFLHIGNCEKVIPIEQPKNHTVLKCTADITRKYFAEHKQLVYVNLDPDIDDDLKIIHSLEMISINTRKPPASVATPNLGYVVVATNVSEFVQNIIYLNREANWNPYARFLVVIRSLETDNLRQIFDVFLALHVNNVVVVNGSRTAELYAYNPFDEFACGKYYTRIIEFGKCLEVTADIYPEKIVTGLRNCFFNVSVPHWPPYAMDPSKVTDGTNPIGTEQYIFKLISEIEHFNYKFNFDYDPESFSTVSENMTVSGPMLKLTNNYTDVMLGGLMLIPSRGSAFSYISGHLDYIDEIRIVVKKASTSPPWTDVYLEFTPFVWILLLLALILYSTLVVILLKVKDKGHVVLILLDNLLSHGSKFRCRQSVKSILFLWVVFAYLVNCFYTSTLMSLTVKPSMNYQIHNEQALKDHDLKPCISSVMNNFRKTQSNHTGILKIKDAGTIKGCDTFLGSIKSVSQSDRMFTIILYSIYLFYKQEFYDEYGRSPVYSFSRPYSKVIYAIYFKNGFPIGEKLRSVALRIRETGLSDKSLNDHYYNQLLKYQFRPLIFTPRFAIPWYPYSVGLFISLITFAVELASQYNKVQISPVDK